MVNEKLISELDKIKNQLLSIDTWEPRKGEYCLFYNNAYDAPILAKYVSRCSKTAWIGSPMEWITFDGYKANKFKTCRGKPDDEDYVFYRCIPFIGIVPEHLEQ